MNIGHLCYNIQSVIQLFAATIIDCSKLEKAFSCTGLQNSAVISGETDENSCAWPQVQTSIDRGFCSLQFGAVGSSR